MADYPQYPQSFETRITPIESISYDRARNGTLRARHLFVAPAYEIECVHPPILTTAERDIIIAHYAAQGVMPFNWEYAADNAVYSVIYLAEPTAVKSEAGTWQVRSFMATI